MTQAEVVPQQPSRPHHLATIAAMAVIASALATFFHEGVGHGGMAVLRHAIPTELTSNHLDAVKPDKWVDAAGTIVNLIVGAFALVISSKTPNSNANTRYFFWLLASLNLLPGAGYFLFSGIGNLGDWAEVIKGLPHPLLLRIVMAVGGMLLYVLFIKLLAKALQPFCSNKAEYRKTSMFPYFVACIFSCIAGAFDPLGLPLFFGSTVPAAFGGSSGMLWGIYWMKNDTQVPQLLITRSTPWIVAGVVLGAAYIAILGRGIRFAH